MKKIKGGIVFILSLLFIVPLVLGATISNVQITSKEITPISALISINATITDPSGISYAAFNYKLHGDDSLQTGFFDLVAGNGQISIYYPHPENGIDFDYQIKAFPVLGNPIYYPSSDTWSSFHSDAVVPTPSTSNNPVTNTNTNIPVTQTSNQTQPTGTTGITGGTIGTITDFAKTPAGIASIVFIVVVILIAMITSSQRKLKKLKIQEQTQALQPVQQ